MLVNQSLVVDKYNVKPATYMCQEAYLLVNKLIWRPAGALRSYLHIQRN